MLFPKKVVTLLKSPTKYTYGILFTIPLYSYIIVFYMFRPYMGHCQGETQLQEMHTTLVCVVMKCSSYMQKCTINIQTYKQHVQLGCTKLLYKAKLNTPLITLNFNCIFFIRGRTAIICVI